MRAWILCIAAMAALPACRSELGPPVKAHCDGLEQMLHAAALAAQRSGRPRPVQIFGQSVPALHREFVFCAQAHVGDFGGPMDRFAQLAAQAEASPQPTGPTDAELARTLTALEGLVHQVNAAPLRR